MFTLIYTENGVPKRYPLPSGDTTVGRAPNCDLIIDDPSISRWHARFQVTGDRCTLTDVGSRNGTYRNGEPVTEGEIKGDDELVLGRLPVTVELSRAERLALSEDHALLDPQGTIYRRFDATGKLAAPGGTAVDAGRLLTLMSEIARTLVKTQPLSDVLTHVVDLAFDNLFADRVFLLLSDEATGTLVPRVVRCRDGSERERATISRTIVRMVMTDRVAMLASDARFDPRLGGVESILAQNIRSLMCTPLWNQDEVIGILYVDNPRSKKFSEADLDLFTALANYAAVAIEQARLTARVVEEQRRRERLQRYHSPAVVDRILQGGSEADAPFIAQEREVTVLFADIVGFTSLSEGMAPAKIALVLNHYFSHMTDIIFEHEGTLDKFIGDAILAVFGAPLDQPDHALRCVRAAQRMRRALAEMNAARPEVALQARMAISTGIATAGDIGSPKRREYTVLGDVVNTASRIESSVAGPGQIVISRNTYDRVCQHITARPLGPMHLRGRAATVEVFEVEG